MNTELWVTLPERIGWTLLHSIWQFAAIGFGLMLALTILRNVSSSIRYVAECVALSLMVLSAGVTFLSMEIEPDPSSPVAAVIAEPAEPDPIKANNFVSEADGEPIPIAVEPIATMETTPPFDSAESGPTVVEAKPQTEAVSWQKRFDRWQSASAHVAEPWLRELCTLWLVGMLLLSLRPITGWRNARRVRRVGTSEVGSDIVELVERLSERIGVNKFVRVVQSSLVQVPTVMGWLQPLILLSASSLTGLTRDQLEAVIAHELAHIRRNDYLVNALQILVETVFFYHPAVWWVSHRMRIEREECCDDVAVNLTGDRAGYARLLVWLDEHRGSGTQSVAALSASDGSLLERVRRILRPEVTASSATGIVALMLLAAGLFGGGIWVSALASAPSSNSQSRDESMIAIDKPDAEKETDGKPKTGQDKKMRLPQTLIPESRHVHSVRFAHYGFDLHSVAYGTGKTREGRYMRVRTWDTQTKNLKKEVPLEWEKAWAQHADTFVLSDDSRYVFGSLGDQLGVWDSASGKLLRRLDPRWESFGDLTLRNIASTPMGNRVASAGITNRLGLLHDGHLYVWDVESGELIRTITSKHTGDVRSMALSDDGRRIAAWPAEGGVGVWDIESGEQIFKFANDNPADSAPFPETIPGSLDQVLGMQFSHDGCTLAIGDLVGIKLIDTETGTVRQQMKAPFRYNSPSFVFSPNDRLLLRYGVHLTGQRESLLWDTRTGKQLASLPIDGTAAAFSTGSEWLAIGRNDDQSAIAVWQLASDAETTDSATEKLSAKELSVDSSRASEREPPTKDATPTFTTGRVVNADGKPIAGAKLRVLCKANPDGKGRYYPEDGTGFFGTELVKTDADGRFKIDSLISTIKYLFLIEGPDESRIIRDDLAAGLENVEIKLPTRVDLRIRVLGDLNWLPRRRGRSKPVASVGQDVYLKTESGTVVSDLIGREVTIEPTDEGGVGIYRGVAIDPAVSHATQSFQVWLGFDRRIKKTFSVPIDGAQAVHEITIEMTPPPEPLQPGDVAGTVLGKRIYGRDIDDKSQREIASLFLSPLMKKYREDHAEELEITEEELRRVEENLDRQMNDARKRQVAETRIELAAAEKRLQRTDLTEAERAATEKRRQRLQQRIDRPNRTLAAFLLVPWKLQRHLYDNYGGGRVLWQQAGLEAFDATKKYLEEQVEAGNLTFANEELRTKVFHYWNRSHTGMLEDREEIEEAFLRPSWLTGRTNAGANDQAGEADSTAVEVDSKPEQTTEKAGDRRP